MLAALHLCQFLHVGVEAACCYLGVATGDSLQQGLMNEAVLILCLHHVIPLRAHQRHMTIDVHGALVTDTFQHCIDHDEAACTSYTRTEREDEREREKEIIVRIILTSHCVCG